MENIKNKELRDGIVEYIKKYPFCKKNFDELFSLFNVVDIVCGEREIDQKDLKRFVFGILIVMPMAIKHPLAYEDKVEELTGAVFNELKGYLNNEYLDYLVENKNPPSTDNTLAKQITKKGIKAFIKEKELMPLTNEDINNIETIYEQELRFLA
jgi:hypothetical protein